MPFLTRSYSKRHCTAQGEDDGRAHNLANPTPPQFPRRLAANYQKRIDRQEVRFAERTSKLSAKVELHRRRLEHKNQALQLTAGEEHAQLGNREQIAARYQQINGARPQRVAMLKRLAYCAAIGAVGVADIPINYNAFTRGGDNPLLVIPSVLTASLALCFSAHYVGVKLKDNASRAERHWAYGGIAFTLVLMLTIAIVRKDSLAEFARQFLPGVDIWGFVTLYFVLQCVLYAIGLAISYGHRDKLRDVYQSADKAHELASGKRLQVFGESCDEGHRLALADNKQQVEAVKYRNAVLAEIDDFNERLAIWATEFRRHGGGSPPDQNQPPTLRLPKSFRDIDDRFNRNSN